jgi:hypothetical protein
MESAEGERLTAVAVGEQSEVADLDETGGQHMERRMNSTASSFMTLLRLLCR